MKVNYIFWIQYNFDKATIQRLKATQTDALASNADDMWFQLLSS